MIDVDFILPAYNEEQSIGRLIENITDLYPQAKVIVIDNNSKDKTAQIAEDMGAEVIFEKKQGKAHAIQKGFSHSKSKYMIMLDADNTYDPKDALKLLEPVMNEDADMVLGSRLKGEKEKGAITNTNMVGNHILSLIASLFYNPISDVCTGYWVFTREVIDYLLNVGIDCAGFEVEAEMFAKVSKGNFRIKELPIIYKNRVDEAKLNSFEDGFKILRTLFKYKFKNIDLYIGALIFFELLPALIMLDTLYII